jgi:hypothetical protein
VTSAPQNVSILTDISANIFALLILFLIIMLAARESAPAPHADTPEVIDVEKDLAGVERSPLSGDELFDLLYQRREASATTRIDLLGQAIDVVSAGQTEHFGSVELAAPRLRQLAAASGGAPAGVYVFSHRFYRGVVERLQALGWAWREVSVPEALRDSSPGISDRGWSAGFAQLIAQPSDRAQFRLKLAELLQSPSAPRDERSSQSSSSHQGSWAGATPSHSKTIVDRLTGWIRGALNAASILGGLGFIAWVELRRKRARAGR